MKEIRNPDNRLVFCLDEKTNTFERLEKGWVTRIRLLPGGESKITHYKNQLVYKI